MTALGKLLRTTAFRLTLVYLALFALYAALLLFFFAFNARWLITEQITTTVNNEVRGLNAQFEAGGIGRLSTIIELRSRRPGSSLYLVATPDGRGLAGNVASLDAGILGQIGWVETSYQRLDSPEGTEHHALVLVSELPGGFHLLVGRDTDVSLRASVRPEFDAWRWQDYWVPLDTVIEFKREAYRRALIELERFIRLAWIEI